MLIVELQYKKPLNEVDRFLEAHRLFLDDLYQKGIMIASGPKEPRDGGVMMTFLPKESFEKLIRKDLFYLHSIADYRFIQFEPNRYCNDFRSMQINYDLNASNDS